MLLNKASAACSQAQRSLVPAKVMAPVKLRPSVCSVSVLVELDRVGLQCCDVRIGVDGVKTRGSVPGRSGRQLAPLDQRHVLPAELREVVEHAGAHDPAADHHDTVVRLHPPPSPSGPSWLAETADDA
jgi:hypothetical protein